MRELLNHFRHRAACLAATENTAAQECTFQRVVAVNATATEARGLACSVEPLKRCSVRVQALAVEGGLDATGGSACADE